MKEVASYVSVDQFQQGKSAYECGYYSVALNAAAGKPGESPVHTGSWITSEADNWYEDMTGLADTPSNKQGMSLWQLYVCIHQYAHLHYQGFRPSLDWIRGYVKHGYPVIIAVNESSVFDIELGDKIPYPWKPTGSHIITVTSLEGEHFVCRDTAAIKAPNDLLPQPRVYDASKLQILSSTAVVLPWLARPVAGFDPTQEDATPVPPVPTVVHESYMIRPGDTLATIASEHHTSVARLLELNEKVLDATAMFYGYRSSDGGRWIFPGTHILV